ncbi:hypothetical protein D3Z45_01255 [Lachnospiraceae bacterium]|nr:hypothetical protein [Lachnospiraceae bacterium]
MLKKTRKLSMLSIIFLVCVILFGLGKGLWGDAADYWDRGTRILQDGKLLLLNIDGFRGYVYPLYCGICNLLGGITGFRIINSLLISFYFTFILPMMHNGRNEMDVKASVSCAIHFMVFSLFFYGAIIYVLSDLFAIILCTMSICLLKKCEEDKRKSIRMLFTILFGFFLYLVYNVRTIYLFASIYLLALFIVRKIRSENSILSKISSILEVIAGGIIASLPQIYMNYKSLKIISMKVPTQGLMLKQLGWGLKYQRYDTYIGMSESHPSAQMNFIEPVGTALLDSLGIEGFASWSDFFAFIIHYPFEVAGIYVRHLINGLLPCWPSLYVTDLDSNKIFLGIGAYTVMFLFLLVCFSNSVNNYNVLSNYIGLLIPVLFIIPGAIEGRFFIAVYIMMVGVLCYNVNWMKIKGFLQIHWLKVAIMFFVGGGLIFSIWSSMLASESVQSIFFYNV